MGASKDLPSDPKTTKADHICVLVHGLWGNPSHLENVRKSLQERHGVDQLHILVSKRNSDNYTYDGIEVGAERVAQEIEEELADLKARGNHITKISIVGYSLGGLIARYCIGLLYSRGCFERLRPVNFTAFASPFLGVKAPIKGYHSTVYNAMASQMLSASGRQLFLTDSYRDSGRPLLEVMTDPNSIFIRGLKAFENRALYANIINDRSAPWFTTGISRTDPYVDLEAVQLNYMKGHDSVLLDPARPVQRKVVEDPGVLTRMYNSGASLASNLPTYALISVLLPIGFTAFTVNSGIQAIRSSQRVQLHNSGKAGSFESYRIPYMLDGALENLATAESNAYLSESEASTCSGATAEIGKDDASTSTSATTPYESSDEKQMDLVKAVTASEFPLLALDPRQERMIKSLDAVGIRKYPVHIAKARHSHAAIIVRKNWESMEEGFVVLKHWLDNEFTL